LIKDPVEIKEQRSVVAAALGALNADQRAALVLVDMEGVLGGGRRRRSLAALPAPSKAGAPEAELGCFLC